MAGEDDVWITLWPVFNSWLTISIESGWPINDEVVVIPVAVKSNVLAISFLFALLYLIGTVVLIPASTLSSTRSLCFNPCVLAAETVTKFFSIVPFTVSA